MAVPDSAYADGGVIGKNPSPVGGTWAWVHVLENAEVARAAGVVLPDDIGMDTVSNNLTEFLALLHAIEALPDGWSGRVYTDSMVTMRRFRSPFHASMFNIPDAMAQRLRAATRRLGKLHYSLLAGHPTAEDLARGTKNGAPVSPWNVLCDHLCNEERRKQESGEYPRTVDQDEFGEDGNCLQACIATVLRLALKDVPHFCKDFKGDDWLGPLQHWCVMNHKLAPLAMQWNEGAKALLDLGVWAIVGGKSPRFAESGPLHAVVYKGGKPYHDPHPDRAGLVEIVDVMVFVPLDPAKARGSARSSTRAPNTRRKR